MAEASQIIFSYKEVVTALLKQEGIHEGVWGIYVKFGIKGANFGESDDTLTPTAIVPVLALGLQKFEKINNLSVDAAVVNPATSATSPTSPSLQ